VPADTPVTLPAELTLATDVLLLVHDTMPDVLLVSVVLRPMHMVVLPATDAAGLGLTVNTSVFAQPVPSE
jgi:hypothetical protein